MKVYVRPLLLIIAFVVFSLLLLFRFTQGTNEKTAFQNSAPQSQILGKTTPELPVRLMIPAINVNANIQYVGVNSKGEMEVPGNTVDVGWFKLGPRLGEKGSAVISGHFNGVNDEVGVFASLYKLKSGDKLYTEDSNGKTITFVVRESRTYDSGYAEDVFSRSDGTYLNLVTCDGVWDGAKKSYTKRLVVFTDIVN